MNDIADQESDVRSKKNEALLVLEDVFVLHAVPGGAVAALRGLSLEVRAGERLVIHGAPGSGKTTLRRLLMGELVPAAGRASLFGTDLREVDRPTRDLLRRSRVGFITQNSADDLIDELTCVENVALAVELSNSLSNDRTSRPVSRELALAALMQVGLARLAQCFPATLSAGERQRVAVVAAVAHGPRLIVADEPTARLDRGDARRCFDVLLEISQRNGSALVVLTHDERADSFAHRTCSLVEGRIASDRRAGEHVAASLVDRSGWVHIGPDAVTSPRVRVERDDRSVRLVPIEHSVHVTLDEPVEGRVDQLQVGPSAARATSGEPGEQHDSSAESRLTALRETDHDASRHLVAVEHASFAVGGHVLLKPVSFRVGAGLFVICGKSGVGKTTLLRLLAGIDVPSAGSVRHREGVRIAVCGVQPILFNSCTVADHLGWVRQATGSLTSVDEITTWSSELDVTGLLDRSTGALSGGERQLVGVLGAFATGATLVLLDEPTSPLDAARADRLRAFLARHANGRAVICASHDEELRERASSWIGIDDAD